MGLPRNKAAGLPYLLERDAPTNSAEQRRLAQRLFASQYYNRYDEDLALPHYGHAPRGEIHRRADLGIANRDRGFYPPSEPWYNDLDSLEPGRLHPYLGRRLSDSTDDDMDLDRHGRRFSRGPTSYDVACDRSLFDNERHGDYRGYGFGNSHLPFQARDMETRDFDEGVFRALDPNIRNLHSPLGPLGSQNMSLDYWIDPGTGHKWRRDPALYHLDGDSDDDADDDSDDSLHLAPRRDSRDFGRVGVQAAGRFDLDYHFDDGFEDDDIEGNFRETRRPRHDGHRSDVDFRFVDDDIGDNVNRASRASTAARSRYRAFPAKRHGGLFSYGVDTENRKRERENSQAAARYMEEDSDIEDIARGLLDRFGQTTRATRHRSTASLPDTDVEDSMRGRRGHPFRPRCAGNRSELDYRFSVDESDDKSSGDFRIPTAAERRRLLHLIQGHGAIDTEHREREWQRKKAQIEERFAKYFSGMQDISREPRDKRGQMPHTAGSRRTADLSDDDLDESPRGRRGRSFRDRQGRNRQTSPQSARASVKDSSSARRTDTKQAPPSYESVTPAQVTARAQAKQSGERHPTSVASALSKNAYSQPHPTAPVVAERTLEGATKDMPPGQQQAQTDVSQAKNGEIAHDGAGEESDNDSSDSSDSGCDTPDEDSETSCAGDENVEEGAVLQSLIHITL